MESRVPEDISASATDGARHHCPDVWFKDLAGGQNIHEESGSFYRSPVDLQLTTQEDM